MREVVGALRRCIASSGFGGDRKARLLIALRGRLFTFTNDFAVGSLAEPWMSIGSGRHQAYGALHVLAELDHNLETKAHKALEIAERHAANVRRPFHLLSAG